MSDVLQVTTAADSHQSAVALAESAVRARLAASATVEGPIQSFYWHEDQFGTGEEWRVVLKTTADRYPELQEHLLAEHPWHNPEVSAVPLAAGSASYLDWVRRWATGPTA